MSQGRGKDMICTDTRGHRGAECGGARQRQREARHGPERKGNGTAKPRKAPEKKRDAQSGGGNDSERKDHLRQSAEGFSTAGRRK